MTRSKVFPDRFSRDPGRLLRCYVKRPRVGQVVVTRFGDATITHVGPNGLALYVQTQVHGTERVQRDERGHWTIVEEVSLA